MSLWDEPMFTDTPIRTSPPAAFDWSAPIDPAETMTLKSWEMVKYQDSRRMVGRFARESARFTVEPDIINSIADRSMVRTLAVHVLADRLPPEKIVERARVVIRVPDTWWDAFKNEHRSRWWLRWLVRRRPVTLVDIVRVAEVTVDLSRWRVFPEADVPYPREFGPPRSHASWPVHTRITDPID